MPILVFYYTHVNRYSFNALAGALEADPFFESLEILIAKNEAGLFEALKRLAGKKPRAILCFSFFTMQKRAVELTVSRIRRLYKNELMIVAGGPHPTGDPLGALKMGFDIVVRGEGEAIFSELLKRIEEGRDYTDLPGIAYLENKDDSPNVEEAFMASGGTGILPVDLDRRDACPTIKGQAPPLHQKNVDRQNPVDLNKYFPFSPRYNLFGPIEVMRGCPYGCNFCQTAQIFGRKPRYRDIEEISKYVAVLRDRNFHSVRFISPDFFAYGSVDGKTVRPEKVEELLKAIRSSAGTKMRVFAGTFPSEVRPDHVTVELVEMIKKYADNDNLIIGAQTGSERILKLCNRGHSVENVFSAVEIIIKCGLTAKVDVMFGLPEENDGDIAQTIEMMDRLIKMGAKLHIHTFMPLPQTGFAKAKTKPVDEKIRKMIARIGHDGFVYGKWQAQERIARECSEGM